MSEIAQNWPNFRRYAPTIEPNNPFSTILVPQRVPFFVNFASKGMDLGPNFLPVRVGFCKFCATEVRGFTVPS